MTEQNRQEQEQIRALSDREQAREKLPIFFGSRENYLHGFKEIVGNAVDIINKYYSKGNITVTLHEDLKTISVSDTGTGIPMHKETDGVPNYVLLFETLFAGTNYDNKQEGKVAVGTNGVGATVLNYTSELFQVVAVREGKQYKLTYNKGGSVRSELIETEASPNLHGSVFTFRLDPSVYTKVEYNPEEIKSIVKHTAATANRITFKFKYKGTVEEFRYPSLEEYFNDIAVNLTAKPLLGPETSFNKEDELNKISILLSTSSEPKQESYLNYNWLPEHGTIHDGIVAGVRAFVNKYAQDNKLLDKKDASISASDVEDSITYTVSVLSTNVEYANQTKLSTNKKLYRAIAIDYVKSLLEAYQAEQPKEFEKFVKHIVQVNKFNNRNNAAKAQLKKKLGEKVDSLSNRVDKLVESDITGPKAELFIAEGDSANGSVVLARDGEFQAAYPLRGKILNCLKADYLTIFNNKIIMDLIKVIGTGVTADKKHKDLETFGLHKSNYGKYIIATDADADGEQIACLLITFFYRLMRPLIEQGMVYIAKTPLYKVKLENDEMIYFYSEKEKDEKIGDIKGKYTISRVKGLGELDAATMSYTAMDPETRTLIRVTVGDAEEMVKTVETFMGTEVGERKEYIENNLHHYIAEAVAE